MLQEPKYLLAQLFVSPLNKILQVIVISVGHPHKTDVVSEVWISLPVLIVEHLGVAVGDNGIILAVHDQYLTLDGLDFIDVGVHILLMMFDCTAVLLEP